MSRKAIHESAGGQHSPTYAHQHHAGVNAHNMPTFRGSVGTESIGEHLCVVTRIGAEHDGAMSIVFGSRRPAENPHTIFVSPAQKRCLAGASTAAARSWRTDSYGPRWLRRLYLPSASIPWPLAWSRAALSTWRGHRITLVDGAHSYDRKCGHNVTESRPLGQGSGPARPAECTARPNVSPMRMVSETKTAAAYSRREDGSTVPHLEACPRPRTYSRLGGKM